MVRFWNWLPAFHRMSLAFGLRQQVEQSVMYAFCRSQLLVPQLLPHEFQGQGRTAGFVLTGSVAWSSQNVGL